MTPTPMPPWPMHKRPDPEQHAAFMLNLPPSPKITYLSNELEDERARAEAWEARARRMWEALKDIKNQERFDEDGIYYRMACVADLLEHADQALADVGELPKP